MVMIGDKNISKMLYNIPGKFCMLSNSIATFVVTLAGVALGSFIDS